jgi:uncharacterized protein YoxC
MAERLQRNRGVTGADLSTTNLLIGIIAGVQLIFLLGIIAGALIVRRMLNQVSRSVSELEREHVQPLRVRVERILDDVSRVSARVEGQSARIDADLSGSLDVAERQARRLATVLTSVTRETTAVVTGVRAAATAVGAQLKAFDPRQFITRDSHPDVPSGGVRSPVPDPVTGPGVVRIPLAGDDYTPRGGDPR